MAWREASSRLPSTDEKFFLSGKGVSLHEPLEKEEMELKTATFARPDHMASTRPSQNTLSNRNTHSGQQQHLVRRRESSDMSESLKSTSNHNNIEGRRGFADLEYVALLAFAMPLCLTGLSHIRVLQLEASCLLSLVTVLGGVVMMAAAMSEYIRDELFKTTMYYAYGCFWLAYGVPTLFAYWGWGSPPDAIAKGLYSLIWGYFTVLMAVTVGVRFIKARLLILPCFVLVAISLILQGLFDCLRASVMRCSDIEWLSFIAGGCQILASLIAIYVSCGSMINRAYVDSFVNAPNPSAIKPLLPMFEREAPIMQQQHHHHHDNTAAASQRDARRMNSEV